MDSTLSYADITERIEDYIKDEMEWQRSEPVSRIEERRQDNSDKVVDESGHPLRPQTCLEWEVDDAPVRPPPTRPRQAGILRLRVMEHTRSIG